jgi:hypothetical protein
MKVILVFSIMWTLAVGSFLTADTASASNQKNVAVSPTPSPDQVKPSYESYRGVTIGMSAADSRAKLGEPSQRSNSGDYYVVSPTESVQVLYDKEQLVRSITINYSGSLKMAPSVKEVLGEDVKKEPDGSIYKLIRYPSVGFWVSYNRTAGSDAVVVITLQKMPKQ